MCSLSKNTRPPLQIFWEHYTKIPCICKEFFAYNFYIFLDFAEKKQFFLPLFFLASFPRGKKASPFAAAAKKLSLFCGNFNPVFQKIRPQDFTAFKKFFVLLKAAFENNIRE